LLAIQIHRQLIANGAQVSLFGFLLLGNVDAKNTAKTFLNILFKRNSKKMRFFIDFEHFVVADIGLMLAC
jgi:hypothetical protein